MAIDKVLIVDDEKLICEYLTQALGRKGFHCRTAKTAEEALHCMEEDHFDLFLVDLRLGKMTGLDLLSKIAQLSPESVSIVITAYGSIESAVDAMRLGAFHYLVKPFTPDTLLAIIEKANQHQSLLSENHFLRQEQKASFIAESDEMQKIQEELFRVAQSSASVFLKGESGTGKEVLANAIHNLSPRKNGPFIRINCAAIPETLIESEFFGHEKGSFTGAHQRRMGRFELAHQGTLLLDEVTEIPLHLQPKLLRALQEQEFERVGGTKPIKVDVRIVATSNRDVEKAIQNQRLREDLYWRLNVIPIQIPPLRQRPKDILPLADYFLEKFAYENHTEKLQLLSSAKEALLQHTWPGNVRELCNLMERVTVLSEKKELEVQDVFSRTLDKKEPTLPQGLSLEELEKRYIIETLYANDHNVDKTAEVLGIPASLIDQKVNRLPTAEKKSS